MQMDAFKEYLERLDFLAKYREPESWEINEAREGMDKLTRKKSSIIEKDAWCSGYRIAIEHVRVGLGRAEDGELPVLGSLGDTPPRTGTDMDFGVRGVHQRYCAERKKDLKTKADPEATIGIIDERGFWRGLAPDTPEVRARLEKKGFEICPSGGTYTVATKQWAKKKEEMGA